MQNFQTIAKTDDIPEGEGRAVEVGDTLVAIFNDGGTFRAISDMCPHMGASLATGHLEDGVVACPWHAWRFDTRDGTWCDNPRVKIDSYDLRVVDGDIQIDLESMPKKPTEANPPCQSNDSDRESTDK